MKTPEKINEFQAKVLISMTKEERENFGKLSDFEKKQIVAASFFFFENLKRIKRCEFAEKLIGGVK